MPSESVSGYVTNRRVAREHMDDPQASVEDIDEALRFIRIVNRRLGGTSAALTHLKHWSKSWPRNDSQSIRILDIGTGSADIPLAIANWARKSNHRVKITAVDLHPVTLQCARQFIGARDDIELVQADALKLMDRFKPGEFEYVHTGMFLHHLDDTHLLTVLAIMDRLATRGMIWNDLLRGWIGRAGVRLSTLRAPPRVRHDAVVSIDAGFTRSEALDLARRAGWTNPRFHRHLLHRFTLVSEKMLGT